jgi:branched-chain amino acid transport system permease protein
VRPVHGYVGLVVGLGAVWGIDQFAIPWTDPYLTDIIVRVGFSLLAAMGLALVPGFTGQFSIGHAGFMAVGAYTGAALAYHYQVPPLVAILCGGATAAVAGVAVGLPSLRLVGDYLAVVTLGFNGIILVAIQNIEFLGGAQGLTNVPVATTFGLTYTFVLLGIFFIRNLLVSGYGRVFEAVRDNEIATRSLGIDTTRVKVTAFVIGAFWAGIAGGLIAFYRGSVFPSQFQYDRSFEILAMVVLGGTGSLSGPLIAAALLTALPEVLRDLAKYRMIVYALLLIGVMIFRPQGLLGTREIGAVILGLFRRRNA